MGRTFAYCRVSTTDQTTDNQVHEIEAAGFAVASNRIIAETVSGSVAASDRKGFASLMGKLEDGDVLVVTKLDRLGHNAMDVRMTVSLGDMRPRQIGKLVQSGASASICPEYQGVHRSIPRLGERNDPRCSQIVDLYGQHFENYLL